VAPSGPRGDKGVSQTEEKVNVEKATSFFEAFSGYFKQNPRTAIAIIRQLAEDIIETVNDNDGFRKDLGYYVGQLKAVSSLIWYHDENELVQQKVTEPEAFEDILGAMIQLARASVMLRDTEPRLGEIGNLIDDATTSLYKIIDSLISEGDDP
jgi:hypothetical protein